VTNLDRSIVVAPGAPLPEHEPFDLILCLQGCAQANDYAIAAGAARGIPVILNPCCYNAPQISSSAPSAVAASSNAPSTAAPSGNLPSSQCVPRSQWLCNCKPSSLLTACSGSSTEAISTASTNLVNEDSVAVEWGNGLVALGTHGYQSCATDSNHSNNNNNNNNKFAALVGAAESVDITTAITNTAAAMAASLDVSTPSTSFPVDGGSVAAALWRAGCHRAVCDLDVLPKAAEAAPTMEPDIGNGNDGDRLAPTEKTPASFGAVSAAEMVAAETVARLVLAADLCARAREKHGCATVWAPVTVQISSIVPAAVKREADGQAMIPAPSLEGVLVVVAPQPSWAAFNYHSGRKHSDLEGRDVVEASAAMSNALASAVLAPPPPVATETVSRQVTAKESSGNMSSSLSAAPLPTLPAAYHVVLAHGENSTNANTSGNSGKCRLEGMGALLPAFTVDEGGGPTGSSCAQPGLQGGSGSSGAGCTHFVKRKQRLCTRMATIGSAYCAEHQPEALAASRAASRAASKALYESHQAKKEARAADSSTFARAEDTGAAGGRDDASGGDAKRPRQEDPSSNNSRPGGRISSTQRRMANPFSRRNLEMNQTGSDEEGSEHYKGDGQGDTISSSSSGSKTSNHKTNNNPLLAAALAPGGWARIYDDPSLPLLVDVGCARGACVRKLAAKHPDWNFLGLEIRPQLVDDAVKETQRQLLLASASASSPEAFSSSDAAATPDSALLLRPVVHKNLHHLAVNAMDRPAFAVLLESLRIAAAEHVANAARAANSSENHETAAAPASAATEAAPGASAVAAAKKTLAEYVGPVHAVAVQFPDPWARARHRRRRLAGPAVCSELAASPAVAPGAWVYVSSDVPDCVAQAAAELTEHQFRWHRKGVAWPNVSVCAPSRSLSSADTVNGVHTADNASAPVAAARTSDSATAKLSSENNSSTEVTPPLSLLTSFLGLGSDLPEGPAVDSEGLLLASPLGVGCGSEREAVCEQLWRKVYRILFTK